jgi:hypothetical protein
VPLGLHPHILQINPRFANQHLTYRICVLNKGAVLWSACFSLLSSLPPTLLL